MNPALGSPVLSGPAWGPGNENMSSNDGSSDKSGTLKLASSLRGLRIVGVEGVGGGVSIEIVLSARNRDIIDFGVPSMLRRDSPNGVDWIANSRV